MGRSNLIPITKIYDIYPKYTYSDDVKKIMDEIVDIDRANVYTKEEVIAMFDKIRAEITDCLKALDEIEKSGFSIYLPNEMSGRRLTYQQCLEFIDKYKVESEETDT